MVDSVVVVDDEGDCEANGVMGGSFEGRFNVDEAIIDVTADTSDSLPAEGDLVCAVGGGCVVVAVATGKCFAGTTASSVSCVTSPASIVVAVKIEAELTFGSRR